MGDEASHILGTIFTTLNYIYIWNNKMQEYVSTHKSGSSNGTVNKDDCEENMKDGSWRRDPNERVFIWD